MDILMLQAAGQAAELTMDDFWPLLGLGSSFLAFTVFVAWMDLKEQAADLAAGRPRRKEPASLL